MAKKAAAAATTAKGKSQKKVKAKPALIGKAKGLDLIRKISLRPVNKKIDAFSPGDTVNVFVKVKEGEKERIQLYKGTVTKVQGSGAGRSFTVRKISAGVGVERTFPFGSPILDRVEVLTHGRVRRSKLYYLRDLSGKAAKITSEMVQPTSSSSAATAEVEAPKETAAE